MKPQDILIALKIVALSNQEWVQYQLAETLGIITSEVSCALERLVVSGLLDQDKKRVNRLALKEFLVHGLKYVFPVRAGAKVRGLPTAHSASPIKEHIAQGDDTYVWAYSYGTKRGYTIEPLYKTVPKAATNDDELYKLLVIVDTLRVGRAREVEIAVSELDKFLEND
jgi:hypothetical protein